MPPSSNYCSHKDVIAGSSENTRSDKEGCSTAYPKVPMHKKGVNDCMGMGWQWQSPHPTPKDNNNKGGSDSDTECTLYLSTWNECNTTINPRCARNNHTSSQHPHELTNKWQHTDTYTVWYSISTYMIEVLYTWSGYGYSMYIVCGCGHIVVWVWGENHWINRVQSEDRTTGPQPFTLNLGGQKMKGYIQYRWIGHLWWV